MVVHELKLDRYRNIASAALYLSPGVNIFYGANAQGKTNLLESIFFCATGHSQRARHDSELVMFGQPEAHITLKTRKDEDVSKPEGYYDNKVDIHVKTQGVKGIALNGVPIRKLSELFGAVLCVLFSPEDLQLVKAGPSVRRRYVDMELCQISPVYCHELQQYTRALRQRNNLLKLIKARRAGKEELFAWDGPLVLKGQKIIAQRGAFLKDLDETARKMHGRITNGRETLRMLYKPAVLPEDFPVKLERDVERDILLGQTHTGPHKDDVQFLINGVDARAYGSQGQQRTASLSAKLAEIDVIRAAKRQNPVLLLDDVLSELDSDRQSFLLQSMSDIQAVLTSTGLDGVTNRLFGSRTVFKVENGRFISCDA